MKKEIRSVILMAIVIALLLFTIAIVHATTLLNVGILNPSATIKESRVADIGLTWRFASDKYAGNDWSLAAAFTSNAFNQNVKFNKYSATYGRYYTIGNPDQPYPFKVTFGLGAYRINNGKDDNVNFGTYLGGEIGLGKDFSIYTKYTNIRDASQAGGISWGVQLKCPISF